MGGWEVSLIRQDRLVDFYCGVLRLKGMLVVVVVVVVVIPHGVWVRLVVGISLVVRGFRLQRSMSEEIAPAGC